MQNSLLLDQRVLLWQARRYHKSAMFTYIEATCCIFSKILKTNNKSNYVLTIYIYVYIIIISLFICLHNTLSIYAAAYMHAVFPRRYSISFSPLKHLVCVSCSLQNCKTTQNSHTSIQVDKTCHH